MEPYPPSNDSNAKFEVFHRPTHQVIKSNKQLNDFQNILIVMKIFFLGFRGLLCFSKVKKSSRHLAKNKKRIQNKKQNERSTLFCFSAIFKSVLQFVYLKSLPTLFIYKKQWKQFEKRFNWKTTKHKPLKKENSFYYQTFTKFVGHLNFITDFRASSLILEFHAWLFLFYITFQQFAAFYNIVLNLLQRKT